MGVGDPLSCLGAFVRVRRSARAGCGDRIAHGVSRAISIRRRGDDDTESSADRDAACRAPGRGLGP